MTIQVPTSGFNAPGVGATGGVPPVPDGNPVRSPGQQPGFMVPPIPDQSVSSSANPPQQQANPTAGDATVQAMLAALIAAQAGRTAPAGTPPAQQPNTQAPSWVPTNVNTFDTSELDDPIIQSMTGLLQSVGKDLDLNRVIGNALAHGDVNLIDVQYLAEKGGANAQYLAQIAKGIVQAVAAKGDALLSEVHSLAGGEAGWNQAAAIFNSSAPAALKTAVKTMLDSRNATQVRAGATLITEYGRASGLLPQRGAPMLNGASSGAGHASGLSKDAFQAELRKLNPNDRSYQEARDSLFSRRSLGKAAGL